VPRSAAERWEHFGLLMGYTRPVGDPVQQVEELKAWIDFGDADVEHLRRLRGLAVPHLEAIATRFYDAIKRAPQANAVFEDEAQVKRLHGSMQRWLLALLTGPYDAEWAHRSQHIGQVHVRVGLPERYMFAAMNLIRQDLCAIAHSLEDTAASQATCTAINKVTDLELCLMTGAYHEAHNDQQLRSLEQIIVEHLPVHVLVLDQDLRVTSATRPQGRIFDDGARPGLPYTAFLPPELVVTADLDTTIRTARASNKVQVLPHVQLAGPPTRHFRITVLPLQHQLARMLLHVEELTDVLDAQARAHQAESLARIGAMAAQLAHEIRNPIAGISGTLQVIVNGLDKDDRRAVILTRVQDQVHRLDRLVRDLLQYSRPSELAIAPTTLSALAEEGLRQAAVDAELELLADHELLTDAGAVQQILVNLLQNARDAAGEGGWVGLRVGPGIELRVMDDGRGVPRELRDTLFQPFVSSKAKGTGLGLAICERRAQEIGGALDLYHGPMSWPDGRRRGAVFRLRLPSAPRR